METLAIYYAIFVCNDKTKIVKVADEPLKSCLNAYHLDKIKIIITLQNEELLSLALDSYKLNDTLWKAVVRHKWFNGLDIIIKARLYNNKEMLLYCLEEKWKDGILRLLKECDDDDFYSLVNTKNLETHCFTPKIVGYKPAKCGAKLDEPTKKYVRPLGRHGAFPIRRDNVEPFIGCSPEQPSREELDKFRNMFEKCINKTEDCSSCSVENHDSNEEFDMVSDDDEVKDI